MRCNEPVGEGDCGVDVRPTQLLFVSVIGQTLKKRRGSEPRKRKPLTSRQYYKEVSASNNAWGCRGFVPPTPRNRLVISFLTSTEDNLCDDTAAIVSWV
jgi:hypothetical protein